MQRRETVGLTADILSESPTVLGYARPTWTISMVQAELGKRGVVCSRSHTHGLMRMAGGICYRPDRTARRYRQLNVAKAIVGRGVVAGAWFVDETTVSGRGTPSGGWSLVQQSGIRVSQSGEDRVYLIGAICFNPVALEWDTLPSSPNSLMWSSWVLDHCGKSIVCDGVTIHQSLVSRRALQAITTVILPPNCSAINPIEEVWAQLQRELGSARVSDRLALVSYVKTMMSSVARDTDWLRRLRGGLLRQYGGTEYDMFQKDEGACARE
jgi:hypothetical protein